jgi:hypothetical protein
MILTILIILMITSIFVTIGRNFFPLRSNIQYVSPGIRLGGIYLIRHWRDGICSQVNHHMPAESSPIHNQCRFALGDHEKVQLY